MRDADLASSKDELDYASIGFFYFAEHIPDVQHSDQFENSFL